MSEGMAGAGQKFGKVAVLFGGTSSERDVSLVSGAAVLAALQRQGVDAHAFDPAERPLSDLVAQRFDRVFIALHGRGGEDGSMQGALEQLGIPYTGSGVLASALAMDKWRTKLVWQSVGIPTPKFALLADDSDFEAVARDLGLPIMIKPASEGSSIGMSKVERAEDLKAAYQAARAYDPIVIAEQFVHGEEVTAAVLDGEALPLIRLVPNATFYDYHAKYQAEDTKYLCPCGLPPAQEQQIQALALKAFAVLGCRGWGRADVMIDRATNAPYFLEMNTSPGMTGHSLVPMAAKQAGTDFDALCLRVLGSAYVA